MTKYENRYNFNRAGFIKFIKHKKSLVYFRALSSTFYYMIVNDYLNELHSIALKENERGIH